MTTGYLRTGVAAVRRLPLVGFEADTRLRQAALTVSNLANLALSSSSRPLRISIHPWDYELLLGSHLDQLLQRVTRSLHYAEVFTAARKLVSNQTER